MTQMVKIESKYSITAMHAQALVEKAYREGWVYGMGKR